MYTVKYKLDGRFHIEHYDHAEWRDHRACRLIMRGIAVTLSKKKL
jgi:hypothetical protein